jgi:hypothetical protein
VDQPVVLLQEEREQPSTVVVDGPQGAGHVARVQADRLERAGADGPDVLVVDDAVAVLAAALAVTAVAAVAQAVGRVGEPQVVPVGQLLLERTAELRDEHLGRAVAATFPPDVEVARVPAVGSVAQHVPPPRVVRAEEPDVVGHDVHHDPEPVGADRRHELGEPGVTTELVVQPARVDHVVAVRRTRRGPQHGREVDVADAQFGEVGHAARCVGERETGVELEPVGRRWCRQRATSWSTTTP